jgi:hypothetical protein
MYLSVFSIFVPVIFGAIFYRSLPLPIKVLFVYICMAAAIEVTSSLFFASGANNIVLYEVLTYFEFILLSTVYFLLLPSKPIRMGMVVLSTAFIVYLLWSDIFRGNSNELNTTTIIIESILLISFFVCYMITLLSKSTSPYLETQPYFVLSGGLLIYFVGNFLVYFYYDFLDGQMALSVWTVHSLLNLILNLIYTAVIWKSKKALPN